MQLRARAFSKVFLLLPPSCMLGACARPAPAPPSSQTTMTGASFTLADDEAAFAGEPRSPTLEETLADPNHPASRVAKAACERKLECDQVGEGKPYADEPSCLTVTRRHAHEELERARCDNGLDDARLTDCIQSVRIAPCADTGAVIERVPACRRALVCAR